MTLMPRQASLMLGALFACLAIALGAGLLRSKILTFSAWPQASESRSSPLEIPARVRPRPGTGPGHATPGPAREASPAVVALRTGDASALTPAAPAVAPTSRRAAAGAPVTVVRVTGVPATGGPGIRPTGSVRPGTAVTGPTLGPVVIAESAPTSAPGADPLATPVFGPTTSGSRPVQRAVAAEAEAAPAQEQEQVSTAADNSSDPGSAVAPVAGPTTPPVDATAADAAPAPPVTSDPQPPATDDPSPVVAIPADPAPPSDPATPADPTPPADPSPGTAGAPGADATPAGSVLAADGG